MCPETPPLSKVMICHFQPSQKRAIRRTKKTHRINLPFLDILPDDILKWFAWPPLFWVVLQLRHIQNLATIFGDVKSVAGVLDLRLAHRSQSIVVSCPTLALIALSVVLDQGDSIPEEITTRPKSPTPALLVVIASIVGLKNKASSSGCATTTRACLDSHNFGGNVRDVVGKTCPSRRNRTIGSRKKQAKKTSMISLRLRDALASRNRCTEDVASRRRDRAMIPSLVESNAIQ